ncbi:MAG TPA: nucleotide exchange factor GrpE [Clostridiaceae bacterium]|nr:nucleotide exchange factor GrpE [Clostridiaceae bacterium]
MKNNKKHSEEQTESIDIAEKKEETDLNSEESVKSVESGINGENANEKSDSGKTNEEMEVQKAEIERLKAELENKSRSCDEYFEKLQRIAAEFDNYKKRVAKERESYYGEVLASIAGTFLPVLDNLERAVKFACSKESAESMKEGIELVLRQFQEAMKNLEIEYIDCVGKEFDPLFQEAVMHIQDESYGPNIVVEEFQKGYKYKDKVIRYSMVKVAN